jgi:uncharacterized coiled-coil DUF342 family protein
MIKFLRWFFSPSKELIVEEHDVYTKIAELEERIVALEAENVETSNCLYELMNSIDAVDARIDIMSSERWVGPDV